MLLQRMIRAARLDAALYDEVEADPSLTRQAAAVVAIVAVCQGLGSALAMVLAGASSGSQLLPGLVLALIGPFVGWVVWSYTAYWIGTRLFHGTATPGELLRTLGYAQAPGALGLLTFLPLAGGLAVFLGGVWTLAAGIVAIRQGLDIATGKAVVTALVGWLIWWVVQVGLILAFGLGAMTMPF
jgi:Yip1 domain